MSETRKGDRNGNVRKQLTWQLRERIKELTALHRTARILQSLSLAPELALARVARDLPNAWQHPGKTVVRIVYGATVVLSDEYRRPNHVHRVKSRTKGRRTLALDVGYAGPVTAGVSPFLPEERELQRSVAKLLCSYLERIEAEQRLKHYYATLENTVTQRTAELKRVNHDLRGEMTERRRRERQIRQYQEQLRELSSKLMHAEETERKRIASLLHDRIGQSLAIMRIKLDEHRGQCLTRGAREWMGAFRQLLDETISHTRALTSEVSPPLLYEIGLAPALGWLGEHYQDLFGYRVTVRCCGAGRVPDNRVEFVVYMAVRELLMNVAKHAGASQVEIDANISRRALSVSVRDNGAGFDPARVARSSFGLFNIREQLSHFKGRMEIDSRPGHGSCVHLRLRCPASITGKEDAT